MRKLSVILLTLCAPALVFSNIKATKHEVICYKKKSFAQEVSRHSWAASEYVEFVRNEVFSDFVGWRQKSGEEGEESQ